MENQNPNQNPNQNNPNNQNFGNPYQQPGNFQNPQQGPYGSPSLPDVPNATAVLVLGIISLVFCGLIGLICSIITLSMSKKAIDIYNANPQLYSQSSFKNLKAGKICATIGLILSSLAFLILIIALIVNVAAFSHF